LIIRKLRNLERMRDAIRILGLILAALLPTWDAAMGDEVRQTEFANPLLGIWAPTIAVCQGREEAKIAISEIRYKSAGSTCGVLWIVESPAAHGINYSVHGLCVGESQRLKLTWSFRLEAKIKSWSEDHSLTWRPITAVQPLDVSLHAEAMDSSLISALAALIGASIGGLTSVLASWSLHQRQVRVQWMG
jgi:hypothetical protein